MANLKAEFDSYRSAAAVKHVDEKGGPDLVLLEINCTVLSTIREPRVIFLSTSDKFSATYSL